MKKITLFAFALALASSLSARTVYLNAGGSAFWDQAGAKFSAYNINTNTFSSFMTSVIGEVGLYETSVDDACTSIIFVRHNNTAATPTWDNKWNQTADLALGTNNRYTITGWGGNDGSWDTYTVVEEPQVEITAPARRFIDETITFSATTNVENPIFAYFVLTPGATTPVPATSPYQPTTTGTYGVGVVVATMTAPTTPLAFDTTWVEVKNVPAPIVIKVKVPAEWTNSISFYNWNADVTGNFVTPTQEGEWYTYTFSRMDPLNLVLVNGTTWPGDTDKQSQTINVVNITESTCYQIGDIIYPADANWGHRTVAAIECSSTNTQVQNTSNDIRIGVQQGMLQVSFEGTQNIALYNAAGQQIDGCTADASYRTNLQKGIYLLRVGNETRKVAIP